MNLLGSVVRVGCCIPIPYFYLVLHELRCWKSTLLVVFNVPSTARSFRGGTPIFCPLRRTWSSGFIPSPPGIEPRVVAWQSITQPLHHASSIKKHSHGLINQSVVIIKFSSILLHLPWCFIPNLHRLQLDFEDFHAELHDPIKFALLNSLRLATKFTANRKEGVWKKLFDWLLTCAISTDAFVCTAPNTTVICQGLVRSDSKHAKSSLSLW